MNSLIPVYSLNWHINQSPALQKLLLNPLKNFIQFEHYSIDDKNIKVEVGIKPVVYFQVSPPRSVLMHTKAKVIWIPMWDHAVRYSLDWWESLPKNLRVIAFSGEISRRAKSVGLDTLDIRYYMDPEKFEKANWENGRTLFYWNRAGLVGEDFLKKLCRVLDVKLLLFRRRTDPKAPSWCDYALPDKLGSTIVKELTFDPVGETGYQQYLSYFNQSNIFIAPRATEGVGLSFIEALVKGCAVFAFDAPTMNEYIRHKKDGYLLKKKYPSIHNSVNEFIKLRKVSLRQRLGYDDSSHKFMVSEWQNWSEIKGLDLESLGLCARQRQAQGFSDWQKMIPKYASFILDW